MSTATYRFSAESADALLQELSDELTPLLSARPAQFRSDLDIWMLVFSVVAGFITSVAANQVPPLIDFKKKQRLTREDLHRLQEELRTARFEADLDAAESKAQDAIEKSLPDAVDDKKATAAKIFDAIKRKLLRD